MKVQIGEKSARKVGAGKEVMVKAVGDKVKTIWPNPDDEPNEAASVSLSLANSDDPLSYRKPSMTDETIPTAARPAKRFRGEMVITAEKGKLKFMNIVHLESYLRGVIAAEMPHESAMDALKAQAVTSRTFSLKVRERYKSKGYDLDDTSMSQMYSGVEAEHSETDAAVSETAGMVLKRSGELIMADFYDDCGGVTSPGDGEADFPPAVLDGPDDKKDFCANGNYHQWKVELKASEISKLISRKDRKKIGDVRSFEIVARDISGRATKVAINGEEGSIEMRAADFRGLVGYDRLKSTLMKVTSAEETIRIEGRGYGHGHGLCQAGAMGMATAPYNVKWRDILKHYFPGVEIVQLVG